MPTNLIDTCTEEVFITTTIGKIKKQFRPLSSVKAKWFIHRILPKDSLLVEWDNRQRLELEIDISQWFSNRDLLEQYLWHELALVKDELDPHFHYSYDYVKMNYGPDSPRQRYYPIIRSVWSVYSSGRLARSNLPVSHVDPVKSQFIHCFGEHPEIHDWFKTLYHETNQYTFNDLEKIAQKLNKLKISIEPDLNKKTGG
jgi:hypothetical protein